jgi:hypothetical protein
MVRSYFQSRTCVSSMIISPTFGWKKVLGRCCLIMLDGIVKLITKTHTNSTSCFGTSFVILISSVKTDLEINSIRIGTIMDPMKKGLSQWQTSHLPFH